LSPLDGTGASIWYARPQEEEGEMPFTINATNSAGAIAISRDRLEDAVNEAIKFRNSGYQNVVIRDPNGQPVEETEIERIFNEKN